MTTTILTHGRVTWTEILHPDPDDIQQLSAHYPQFHVLNLQDCLNELEIPKIDHQDDYLFLVVQFPKWEPPEQIPEPAEVDIFISRGTLVTSHHGILPALDKLLSEVQADENIRERVMGHGASPLLYHLLNALVDDCFPLIHKIDHRLRQIEQNLFSADTRSTIHDIALMRRTVIAMRHILYPQLDIVRALEHGTWPFIHEELDIYWGDISDHLAQLGRMLDEHAEVMAGLSETIDTLASHRIDEVVRLLTVVTILTLPLTLLATIFGMNIVMPFSAHPLLFYGIVSLGVLFTLILVLYLNKHKWM